MTLESTLALALAMLILAVSPGPGVFATVSQALSAGFRSALDTIAGIVTGDLLFLLLALFGLSAVARTMGELFFIVRLAGGAYLVWLGVKMWLSAPVSFQSRGPVADGSRGRRYLAGLLITLGNPKVILFYVGFLPTFLDLSRLSAADIGVVAAVVSAVLATVMAIYAYTADRTRRLFTRPAAVRRLNRCAGTLMVGAGITIAVRR